MVKVLYHYTCKLHLPKILEAGFLKLTESNLRRDLEFYKPVVWMTTAYSPDENKLGLEGFVDKTEIRIHVNKKPSFQFWKTFSKKYRKLDKKWFEALEENRSPSTWWVSTEIVPLEDILLIENRYTNEVYYSDGKEVKQWPKRNGL